MSVTTGPSQGTATYDATTGKFTYTSNGSASGSDSFTYTIVDRDGDSSLAPVTVEVGEAHDSHHAQAGPRHQRRRRSHPSVTMMQRQATMHLRQTWILPHNYGSDGAGTTKFIAGVETVNGVHYTYSVSSDGACPDGA